MKYAGLIAVKLKHAGENGNAIKVCVCTESNFYIYIKELLFVTGIKYFVSNSIL